MPGLFWLLQGARPRGLPAGCLTFVRGTDEWLVLAGLGVDPDDAMRPGSPEFSSAQGITIVRSGEWLVALEAAPWPRGIRADVLRRLSAGAEVVVVFEDIAKGNHKFAHAAGGEVVTEVTTAVPPNWGGTQPDRLRPLAEELGMQREDGSRSDSDSDYDLGDLEILLLIAETAFGLSLDEADLNSPLLKAPDEPADPTPRRPASAAPVAVRAERIRPHVERLLASGVTADAIATQTGNRLSPMAIDALLRGANMTILVKTAEQVLAMRVPPST
jgi:hypothetical protein